MERYICVGGVCRHRRHPDGGGTPTSPRLPLRRSWRRPAQHSSKTGRALITDPSCLTADSTQRYYYSTHVCHKMAGRVFHCYTHYMHYRTPVVVQRDYESIEGLN